MDFDHLVFTRPITGCQSCVSNYFRFLGSVVISFERIGFPCEVQSFRKLFVHPIVYGLVARLRQSKCWNCNGWGRYLRLHSSIVIAWFSRSEYGFSLFSFILGMFFLNRWLRHLFHMSGTSISLFSRLFHFNRLKLVTCISPFGALAGHVVFFAVGAVLSRDCHFRRFRFTNGNKVFALFRILGSITA